MTLNLAKIFAQSNLFHKQCDSTVILHLYGQINLRKFVGEIPKRGQSRAFANRECYHVSLYAKVNQKNEGTATAGNQNGGRVLTLINSDLSSQKVPLD